MISSYRCPVCQRPLPKPKKWNPKIFEADRKRFEQYVFCDDDDDFDCELWEGAMHRNLDGSDSGYGQFKFQGKVQKSHQVAYQLYGGPIPGDMTIDHWCGKRACVNPDHLQIVTMRRNQMLRSEKVKRILRLKKLNRLKN